MLQFNPPTWKDPRGWQAEALASVVIYFGVYNDPVIVSAIMGAGKSILISEICNSVIQGDRECVIVSTPKRSLVEDLYREIHGNKKSVGAWYSRRKRICQVIVVCNDSCIGLAEKLNQCGIKVILWIADECHRTQSETILKANEILKPDHALGMTATPFRSNKYESISLFQKSIFRYSVREAQRDRIIVPWRMVHAGTKTLASDFDTTCLNMIKDANGPGVVNASSIEDASRFSDFLTANNMPSNPIHSHQSVQVQYRNMRRLKEGKIKAVVHVNLLSEGVDYPWLKWLLLRRKVEARVRFIQEIGRLLRSHEGKAEAVFYDPYDLFGEFKLSYEEALGEPPEKPEFEGLIGNPDSASDGMNDPDPAIAMLWAESFIRTMIVRFDAHEMIEKRKIVKKSDRLVPSTALQKILLTQLFKQANQPYGDWGKCLWSVSSMIQRLRFGFAADLIECLQAYNKNDYWPFHEDVPLKVQDDGQTAVNFGAMVE